VIDEARDHFAWAYELLAVPGRDPVEAGMILLNIGALVWAAFVVTGNG